MTNNIFDGFENESPEEVANKLGIKKNSVTEDVFAVVKDKKNTLPQTEYENDSKWRKLNDIKEVKAGMRIRTNDWKEKGPQTILGVIWDDHIIILNESINETSNLDFEEIKDSFEIYKEDEYIETQSSNIEKADQLEVGGLLIDYFENKINSIKEIYMEDGVDGETYVILLSDMHQLQLTLEGLQENCQSINFDYCSIKKDLNMNEEQWTSAFLKSEISIGMRLFHETSSGIKKYGKIFSKPGFGRENYTILYENGEKKVYNPKKFMKIKDNIKIYVADFMADYRRRGLSETILGKDDFWTDIKHDKIPRNTRLRKKLEKIEFSVQDNRNGTYVLKEENGGSIFYYEREQLKSMFDILEYDSVKNASEQIYKNNEEYLKDENNWHDIMSKPIKYGMIIKEKKEMERYITYENIQNLHM